MLLHQRLASGALLPGIDTVVATNNQRPAALSSPAGTEAAEITNAREFLSEKELKLTMTEHEPFPIYAYRKTANSDSEDYFEGELQDYDGALRHSSAESSSGVSDAGEVTSGDDALPNDENRPLDQEFLPVDKFIPISPKQKPLEKTVSLRNNLLPKSNTALNPLIPVFQSGMFSDVSVFVCLRDEPQDVLNLHRIILCQSPFFKRLLVQHGKKLALNESAEAVRIFLDFDEHPLVSKRAVREVFQALYCFDMQYEALCKLDMRELLEILTVACFFEVEYISDKAFQCLLRQTSPQNIVTLAHLTDSLYRQQTSGAANRRHGLSTYSMLAKYQGYLQQAYLTYVCQLVGTPAVEINLNSQKLAKLPWLWIEKVLKSDLLVVGSEFARYQLVKETVQLRLRTDETLLSDVVSEVSTVPPSSLKASTSTLRRGPSANSSPQALSKGVVGSIIDSIWTTIGTAKRKMALPEAQGGSAKHRKLASLNDGFVGSGLSAQGHLQSQGARYENASELDEGDTLRNDTEDEESDGDSDGSQDSGLAHLKTLFNSPSPKKKSTAGHNIRPIGKVESLFRSGVVYTYMEFLDLEAIKKDKYIPERLVVEHFWLQQELAYFLQESKFLNAGAKVTTSGTKFPPFRFSVSFKDLRKRLLNAGVLTALVGQTPLPEPKEDSGVELVNSPTPGYRVYSTPVTCAGFQFRISLEIMTDTECEEWASKSKNESIEKADWSACAPHQMSQGVASSMRPLPAIAKESQRSEGSEILSQSFSKSVQLLDASDELVFRSLYVKAVLQVASASSPGAGRSNAFSTPTSSKAQASAFTGKLSPKVPLSYKIYAFQESLLESPFKRPLVFSSKDRSVATVYTAISSLSPKIALEEPGVGSETFSSSESFAGLEWLAYSEPVAECNRFEQGYVVPFSLISKISLDANHPTTSVNHFSADDVVSAPKSRSSACRKRQGNSKRGFSAGSAPAPSAPKYAIIDIADFSTLVAHITFH